MVQRPSELEDLGIALGLIEGSGSSATLNTEFFTDPRGVLGGTLADPDRRAALVDLFTDLLGSEGTPHGFDAGTSADETWLPLVEGGPGGLYVLLTPHPPQTTDGVRVSVAGRVQHVDNGVDASASIVLPLICFDDGGLVPLVGTADGPVSIQCRVGGEDGPLIDDDGLVLHAVSVRATIATQALATPPATLQVLVEGLRFGADATPLDVDLADLAGSVGGPAAHLVLAALRAQASTSPELAQLFDLLGLGGAAGIPSLDLGALASDPHGTLTAWLRSVVLGTASRTAWLSKLAGLLGDSVPSPDELCFVDTTATKVCVTVAVDGDPTTGAPRVRIGLLARHEVAGIATGHLRATVNAVDVVLTQPPGVVVFPSARAVLRLEGTAGPLVHGPAANNRRIQVGSLDAGIELRPDGSIVAVLTANDAIVDLVGFPTLDLTDADAVIGAAEDVAETALNDLVGDLAGLLNGSPRVRALASLLGLVAPPGPAWAPALVNPASLLADPLREICCYHSRVLAEDGGWGRLLQQLVVLVQPGDDPPPALTGAGTAAEPWRAPFAVDGTKRVDLFALGRPPDGDHPQLVLGVAVRGATDIGDGKELGLIVRSEVLAATLPRAADCVGEASVTMMPLHEVVLRLGDDLHLDAGAVEVLADRVEVGVRWRPGDDLEPIVRVSDPRVSTGGSFVELPDIDGDIDLDALGTAGWQLFGDLLGAWFSGGGRSWWRLSALVGLLPGVPDAPQMLPIGDLALPRAWDGLLHLGRGHVTGNGTYDDPWEISTGAAGLPNPVLWLDPDGPPDLRLPRELFPPALSDALDNATTPLDPERLATFLGRAVTLSPTLADVVDEDLAAALRFLRDQLAGTDGLVAAAAQEVTGWNRIDLASALHLGEPAVLDLDAQVPGLPGGSPRVFVSAPLPWAAAWRGQDPARVIDLREAGREPATFDLDHVTAGGSWFVLLPPRADAVTATIADGLEGLRARLHAAVAAVRDAAGAPVVLVAHATSGHPARLVAADAGLVSDVVTVGTPHSTSAIGWVAQDEGRRALRALHRLRARARGAGADLGPLADLLDGPLAALEGIVAEVDGTDVLRRHVPFPFADYVTPASWPALAAGVTGHAVVATIVPAEVDGALTTLVGRAIEGLATLPAGRAAPTHLGIGLRGLRRDGSSLAGEVRVDTRARVDVHLVEITPGDHRAVPRLGIHADISRNGGWLVRPADVSMGRRQDPRVGRAEIDLALDLGDPSPAVSDPAPRLSARIVLHDVTVLGRFHERWVVDDTLLAALADGTSGGTGTLPEVRIVLGMVATALGNVGGTGPVRDLADLLVALQVGTIDGNTFDFTTEGLERLLREPDQVVADLLADADRVDDFLSALAACTGGTTTGDTTMLGTGALPFGLAGPLASPSLRIRTSGPVEVAKEVTVDADVTIDPTGRAHGSVTVTSPVDVGGLGNPRFVVGIDTATAGLVTVAFELDGPDGAADRVPLFPDPDLVALARLAGQVITAEIARQALTWAHAQQPALVGAVLNTVGLLNPPAAPEPVRSLLGLVRDPVAWLTSDVALGAGGTALTPARVVAAVDAVAALLGQVPAGGVLTLPGGMTLTASAAGDRTRLRMALPPPAGGAPGLRGTAGLLIGEHLDAAPELNLQVPLGSADGVDDASVHVGFDASGPTLSASITPEGGSALVLPILPPATWGDLASLAEGGVQQVLPMLLDAVADEVDAVGTLGDALGLRTNGAFDGAKLAALAAALAADPAAAFPGALTPVQVATALEALLEEAGVPNVAVSGATLSVAPVTGLRVDLTIAVTPQLCVSVGPPPGGDPIELRPGLSFGGEACIDSAGTFTSQLLVEVTDPALLATAPVVLLPFVRIQASSAGSSVLLAGAWNGTPRQAGSEAIAACVAFGTGTVEVTCLTGDYVRAQDQTACIALWAGGLVLPLIADLVLAADAVKDLLNETLLGETALIGQALHDAGILVRTGDDYAAAGDLLANMETFGRRLVVLGAKLLEATANQVLGDALGPLEITPVVETQDGRRWFGLTLALAEAMTLADGSDVRLELDTYRGTFGDDSEERGLSLFLASHPVSDPAEIRVAPRIAAREIGLRLAGAAGGPLLSDPIGIGEAGLFGTYEGGCAFTSAGEVDDDWVTDGGGVRLAVRRLAVPLTGSDDGGNPVAQKILSQATETSQAGDDEPLAPSVDAELEVGTDGVQLHLGLGDPPWWLPVQRSFGPLYVDQVGLDIDPVDAPNEIAVLFDGGIELAGLSIGVDDLAIIVTLDTRDVAIGLAGLAIGYDSNGLKLAGGLRRHGPDYLGMLQIQFGEFGLTAIGGLGEHPHDGGTYTALFVFGVLTAPLGGPPPFFVTAIGAGFGVNRRLVLPETLDALPQFPLVAAMSPDSDLAQDPMGALDALGQTFPPHRGTFWFAAGVRFTSFVLVESIAVLSVEVGDGLEVALTGISRTTLPRPELPMASVELALRARFSTREGVLAIQAELTENSWLLSSSCRLTGGFAFVVWFRTGQFVLSLGGYHPRFAKPDDFPDLDRLGYHWQVSSVISIKGGLYFALTSSAVMAGGSFEASYRTSWSWASFEMGWNALIMWDPFAYDFEVYVRISAGVRIRVCVPLLGCATVGFSFSIGANVHVLGPELRGTAVLDLDVTTITVAFGASGDSNADEGIPWDEFRRKYLTDGDTSNGLEAALGNGRYVEAGAPASAAAGAADGPWLLLPEFDVALTTKTASNRFGSDPVPGVDQIDLGPMRRANVVTDLEVKLIHVDGGDDDVTGNEGVTLTPRLGQQPEAIWRTHAKSSDAPPAADLVTAVTGATLVVRSKILDRTGEIPVDQVDVGVKVHPLPLRQQVRWRAELVPWVNGAAALVEWAGNRSVSEAVDLLQTRGTLAAVRDRDRWRVAAELDEVVLPDAAPALDGLSARASALVTHDGGRAARPVSLAGRAAPPRVRSLGRGTTPPEPTRVKVGVADPPAVAEPPAARLRPRLDAVLHEPTSTAQAAITTHAREVGAGLPRVAAPSLEAVTAEAITSIGAHLHLTRPSTPAADAVGGRATTSIAGDVHEWRAADVKLSSHAAAALQEIDDGLDGAGVALRAGDVHVWQVPDSRRDHGTERPTLHVESEVPVRVVAIDRGGRPLADELLTSGDVAVPPGADRISLAVTGEAGGMAGWHTGARLARISPTTLLCRRGTVRSEAAGSRRSRRETATGLVPAMDVVPTRGTVETTLPATTRTVVLGLSPTTDDVDPEAFAMTLERATRDESEPIVLRVGDRLYGLFGVRPDEDAGTMVAAVRTDARWELAGVLGTEDDPRTAADWLASGGLTRLAGLVTAPAGSARVRWCEPDHGTAP